MDSVEVYCLASCIYINCSLWPQVGERIAATVLPNKDFFSLIAVNPDLYGPFWVPTTLIFVLFAVTTISESLQSVWGNTSYVYDLTALSWAISTVYAFVVFIPLILWGICAFYKVPLKLLELMNIYGYGLAIWIPVSFLCIINVEILKWVLVSVAFASTSKYRPRKRLLFL